MRSDDLDSVGELYTENEFRQLVVAVEATPAFLGGLGELEDHGERGLVGKTSLGRTVRWRTVANELSMMLVTGMRIVVSAHPAGIALVLAYGVTIRDEGHREHVSGQADPYDEP
jgi:hypothetical protein